MMTPADWDWVDGELKHLNMGKKLKSDLPHLIDGYHNENKDYEMYFHKDPETTTTTGWEDYAFRWLDEHEDDAFHAPGPGLGKRCESLNLFTLLLCLIRSEINVFTVVHGSEEYEEYVAQLEGRGE